MSGLLLSRQKWPGLFKQLDEKELSFGNIPAEYSGKGNTLNFSYAFSFHPAQWLSYFSEKKPQENIFLSLGMLYDPSGQLLIQKKWAKLACEYREEGFFNFSRLSGSGELIVVDSKKDTAWILTDRLGFIPLYAFIRPDGQGIIGSHADIIASLGLESLALDEVSLAEFLHSGNITFPFTGYKGIFQLDPGSIYRWDIAGLQKVKTFWQPLAVPTNLPLPKIAEKMAEAIKSSVRVRVRNSLDSPLLMLSGGLDSRLVLFASEDPSLFRAITFCNQKNRETAIAQKVARLAGSKHTILYRDFDYYGRIFEQAIKVGGLPSFPKTAHALGFLREISKIGPSIVLSGLFMDTLFKGMATNLEWYRPGILRLHKERHALFNFYWYGEMTPAKLSNRRLLEAVFQRWQDRYRGLDLNDLSEENLMRIEFKRIYPIFQINDASFLYRTLPYDFFLADKEVLEFLSIIPPSLKLNRLLSIELFKNICPRALKIENANFGFCENAPELSKIFSRISSRLGEKMLSKEIIWNSGSWINWVFYYKHSKIIRKIYDDIKIFSREYLSQILGNDPFLLPYEELIQKEHFFNRILTLGKWLSMRNRESPDHKVDKSGLHAIIPLEN